MGVASFNGSVKRTLKGRFVMLEVTDLVKVEDCEDEGNGYLYIILVFECFLNTVMTLCNNKLSNILVLQCLTVDCDCE